MPTLLRRAVLAVGIVVALAVLAASGRAQPAAPRMLAVPDRANEHVSAAASHTFVALAWAATTADGRTDIFSAVSRDGGASFASPVRVNDVAGQASANAEQPPRVALVSRPGAIPEIVVVWTARGDAGTRLLTARSRDGGTTFGRAAAVAGSDAAGNRGWHSIAVDGDGRVHAAWLDHRDGAASGGHAHHQHGTAASRAPEDGTTRAQRSQIFAASLDGSVAARSLARGVCYCCKTAMASAPGGGLFVAWRHVYAGNRRDIAFASSRDGGRTFTAPIRISEDEWQLDGCPENGPAMTVDAGQRVHVIWPTLVAERGRETLRLFHASTADGRTFTPRAALPTAGAAYHPQLVVTGDGTLAAAWDEFAAGGRRLKVAHGRPDASGRVQFTAREMATSGSAFSPALAATSSGVVVAWTARDAGRAAIMVSAFRPR
jgi:hypothetical protein